MSEPRLQTVTVDHPALVLLADALDATSGPASGEDIAKLLGHALRATGYTLVRIQEPGAEPASGSTVYDRAVELYDDLAVEDLIAHWTGERERPDRKPMPDPVRFIDEDKRADYERLGWTVYVATPADDHAGAVEEVERLRRVVCTCGAYEINFSEGSPIAHRAACPAVPPTPRGQSNG